MSNEQTKRVRHSFGTCHSNPGIAYNIIFEKYKIDNNRRFYLFDIVPMGAVRMSQSDKWKTNPNHPDPQKRQRKRVAEYFSFKDTLRRQASMMNFNLSEAFEVVFFIPMPDSWSNLKKERMNGMPHQSRPDTDNLTKALKDTLLEEDSKVWHEKCEKRWAYRGSIVIFQ